MADQTCVPLVAKTGRPMWWAHAKGTECLLTCKSAQDRTQAESEPREHATIHEFTGRAA